MGDSERGAWNLSLEEGEREQRNPAAGASPDPRPLRTDSRGGAGSPVLREVASARYSARALPLVAERRTATRILHGGARTEPGRRQHRHLSATPGHSRRHCRRGAAPPLSSLQPGRGPCPACGTVWQAQDAGAPARPPPPCRSRVVTWSLGPRAPCSVDPDASVGIAGLSSGWKGPFTVNRQTGSPERLRRRGAVTVLALGQGPGSAVSSSPRSLL